MTRSKKVIPTTLTSVRSFHHVMILYCEYVDSVPPIPITS
jgi:hypothetical protein